MARVLIAAGGTGGHVYPALALAEELRDRGHGVRFAGGRRIETRLVPEAGFPLDVLPMRGLPRRPTPGAVLAGVDLVRALVGARRLLRTHGIELVVGMGGYPSLAPSLAAGGRGIPVVLHEQNATLSLAHRLSVRRARVLALSLPLTEEAKRPTRTELVGNPIRSAIRALAEEGDAGRETRRAAARSRFGLLPTTPTLLVFGGSQGARALNTALPHAVGSWTRAETLQVIHLTGVGSEEGVRELWGRHGGRCVVLPYVDAMEDAYASADLVLARAGASTVAELTALGLPSVLVPLPHAPGGAQAANAHVLHEMGAARCVPEEQSDLAAAIRDALVPLLEDPETRRAMGTRASALGRPDATLRLADLVERTLP